MHAASEDMELNLLEMRQQSRGSLSHTRSCCDVADTIQDQADVILASVGPSRIGSQARPVGADLVQFKPSTLRVSRHVAPPAKKPKTADIQSFVALVAEVARMPGIC